MGLHVKPSLGQASGTYRSQGELCVFEPSPSKRAARRDIGVADPSVPIWRAQRKVAAIRPGFVNGASERWARQQALSVRSDVGMAIADWMRPVGIEQERCSAAIREAEAVARGPFAVRHYLVEPGVGGVQ